MPQGWLQWRMAVDVQVLYLDGRTVVANPTAVQVRT